MLLLCYVKQYTIQKKPLPHKLEKEITHAKKHILFSKKYQD